MSIPVWRAEMSGTATEHVVKDTTISSVRKSSDVSESITTRTYSNNQSGIEITVTNPLEALKVINNKLNKPLLLDITDPYGIRHQRGEGSKGAEIGRRGEYVRQSLMPLLSTILDDSKSFIDENKNNPLYESIKEEAELYLSEIQSSIRLRFMGKSDDAIANVSKKIDDFLEYI